MEMQPQDLKNRIRQMEIGESIELPLERMAVVRQYAYELGLVMERTYHAAVDKESKTIKVTREV